MVAGRGNAAGSLDVIDGHQATFQRGADMFKRFTGLRNLAFVLLVGTAVATGQFGGAAVQAQIPVECSFWEQECGYDFWCPSSVCEDPYFCMDTWSLCDAVCASYGHVVSMGCNDTGGACSGFCRCGPCVD